MNLTELKKKTASELIQIAQDMGVEGMARSRKQEVVFRSFVSQGSIVDQWSRGRRRR